MTLSSMEMWLSSTILTSASKVPRMESYLTRWDACLTPPESLMATTSRPDSARPCQQRRKLRPVGGEPVGEETVRDGIGEGHGKGQGEAIHRGEGLSIHGKRRDGGRVVDRSASRGRRPWVRSRSGKHPDSRSGGVTRKVPIAGTETHRCGRNR